MRGLRSNDDVAWAAGYADFYHGRTVDECPYTPDRSPGEVVRWREGWQFAAREKAGR